MPYRGYFLSPALTVAEEAIINKDFGRLKPIILTSNGNTLSKPEGMRTQLIILAHLAEDGDHLALVGRVAREISVRAAMGDDWKDSVIERQATKVWSHAVQQETLKGRVTVNLLNSATYSSPGSLMQAEASKLWADKIRTLDIPPEKLYRDLVTMDRGQRYTSFRREHFYLLSDIVQRAGNADVSIKLPRDTLLDDFRISGIEPSWLAQGLSHIWFDTIKRMDTDLAQAEIKSVRAADPLRISPPLMRAATAFVKSKEHTSEFMDWMIRCEEVDAWTASMQLRHRSSKAMLTELTEYNLSEATTEHRRAYFGLLSKAISLVPPIDAVRTARQMASPVRENDIGFGFDLAQIWREAARLLGYDDRIKEVKMVAENASLSERHPLRVFAQSDLKRLTASGAAEKHQRMDAFNAKFSGVLQPLMLMT